MAKTVWSQGGMHNFWSTSAESHQPEQPQHSNHPEVAQITLAVAEPLHLQSIGLWLHGAANCIFRNLLNISCVTPKMLISERMPNSVPALFFNHSQVSQERSDQQDSFKVSQEAKQLQIIRLLYYATVTNTYSHPSLPLLAWPVTCRSREGRNPRIIDCQEDQEHVLSLEQSPVPNSPKQRIDTYKCA